MKRTQSRFTFGTDSICQIQIRPVSLEQSFKFFKSIISRHKTQFLDLSFLASVVYDVLTKNCYFQNYMGQDIGISLWIITGYFVRSICNSYVSTKFSWSKHPNLCRCKYCFTRLIYLFNGLIYLLNAIYFCLRQFS